SGELETEKGLRAKSVVIRTGTRCRGALVGDRVELGKSGLVVAHWGASWAGQSIMMRGIGRMTDAEDVYGADVVLGSHARCKRIFAETVELGDGCTVDQVTYTKELHRSGGRQFMTHPAEKVTELPTFPL
ncbi:MAG: hypothetical protein ACRD6W_05860, partial [Nitrososphaerales archaeon]